MNKDEHLRYPIGRFTSKESYTPEDVAQCIRQIEVIPQKIADAVKDLTPAQLDTPYREGGWTIRQVLHHLPDSHLNAYIRLKWTLTEDTPTIKAYDESAWAETPETKEDPAVSLHLLTALHTKWVTLLKMIPYEDLQKGFIHPETGRHVTLARQLATYAWHGEHHLAHILLVANRK